MCLLPTAVVPIIGIAQGGAKGAEAPPTPILEGAKPLHF